MLGSQTVVDAAMGMRGSTRVAHSTHASSMSCASTPVISLTLSNVKFPRYSAQISHTGRPVCTLPSLSTTSNSPYSAGSMSGSNSDRSATQPATLPASSRMRETSWVNPLVCFVHVSPSQCASAGSPASTSSVRSAGRTPGNAADCRRPRPPNPPWTGRCRPRSEGASDSRRVRPAAVLHLLLIAGRLHVGNHNERSVRPAFDEQVVLQVVIEDDLAPTQGHRVVGAGTQVQPVLRLAPQVRLPGSTEMKVSAWRATSTTVRDASS